MDRNLIYGQQSVVIAAILMASTYVVFFNIDNGGTDDDDVKLYYATTGAITAHTDDPGDIKIPVYYGDGLFRTGSTERDIRMANFALGLELTCFHHPGPDGDMSEKVSQVNLKAFYRDIGFTDVEINQDFESEPEIDSIGVGIGSKVIDGSTVLAVAINGVHYSAQFGGNFKVGYQGIHEGFRLAADTTVSFIREYISEKSITGDVKILLTGYSRGAAVSNIAQAMIDDAMAEGRVGDLLGNVNISKDGLYGFGFMTPMTVPEDSAVSPSDQRYDNIYSYIDPNDLVPMVPPALYGFTHYGHVIWVPSNDRALVPTWYGYVVSYFGTEVQELYDRSAYRPAEGLEDKTEGEVMQEFLNRVVMAITDGDRQVYYDELQDSLSWAMFIMFSDIDMPSDIYTQMMGDIVQLVIAALAGTEYLEQELHYCLDGVFDEYGLEEEDGNAVVNAMAIVTLGVVEASGGVTGIFSDPYFMTLYDNGLYMLMPHMPQNICGWMYYLDPNYPETGITP